MSGIIRDVYIYGTPNDLHIRDFELQSALDGNYLDALFTVITKLRSYHKSEAKFTVEAALFNWQKEKLWEAVSHEVDSKDGNMKDAEVRLGGKIKNPEKWSAEHPSLYLVTITLKNALG